MVNSRHARMQHRSAPPTRTTVAPWPSASDIPERIKDWSTTSGYLDKRSNDSVHVRPGDTLYSIRELEELWGISDTTLYREVRAGELLASKVGGQWRISESAMVAYRRANEPLLHLSHHPSRRRRSP